MGHFDGKVVVITGAGGGIGRAHALYFAQEGARVVVNDLGGARDGAGESHRMADQVVAEIEKLGGEAVANYDSVSTREGADALVGAALSRFGRVDVLVNNAGILRDKTMLKMSEEMFDSVIAVHLKGTWLCTQAAARAMVEQGDGGAIVNTTSVAGLKGNFGQTNYAAAKAGIYGITLSASQELLKHGVRVNAVAPIAKTRMTEELAVVPDEMLPEHISPVVAFLAHDASVTGRILGVHGEHVFEYKMTTSDGMRRDDWSIDSVADSIDAISGLTPALSVAEPAVESADAAASPAEQVAAVFQRMPAGFLPDKAPGWSAVMHFKVAGAGGFTVAVKDGVCTTAPTLEGTATCEVGTDVDTFLGMVDGSVDGQQAFMSGKVTATNLADMMKYKGAFSKEQAAQSSAAQSSAAQSPAAQSTPPSTAPKSVAAPAAAKSGESGAGAQLLADLDPLERVHWIFRLRRELFGDKPRSVQLSLTDDGEHALGEGAASRIRTDSAALCAFLDGTLDARAAVESLAIVTTRMQDLLWFRETLVARDWTAVVADAVRARPVKVSATYKKKVFHGAPIVITPEHAALYARATDDDNAAYSRDERYPLAPPMLAVRYHHELARQALMEPGLELNLLRLVFGEQHMRFFSPLRVGDVVSPKCELASVEHKESGSVLRYRFRLLREGELINETISSYFVRGDKARGDKARGSKAADAKPRGDRPAYAGIADPTFEQRFLVRADQSRDYAVASLDDNPIHVDENIARAAGFEGIINHGLGTLALTSRTLVAGLAGDDPQRLIALSARFSAPVLMKERLTVRARPEERTTPFGTESGLAFDVVKDDGAPVIVDGFAVLHARR